MPLPSAHPFGTVPDSGTIDTSLDNGKTHADSQLPIAGDMINQHSADIINLYGAENTRRTVLAVTAPVTLTSADREKLITNEGATGAPSTREITLPSPVAGAPMRFYNQNVNGQRLRAPAGKTIRIGSAACAAAGYVEINDGNPGQMLILWAINATEWVAEPTIDSWSVN